MDRFIPIALFGISHKTAAVEVRESVALSETEQSTALQELMRSFDIDGCMILSTCNRTEFYISGEEVTSELPKIRKWADTCKNTTYFNDDRFTYISSGIEAVRHFFSVISGLDSQIIGEPQITGQVKNSYTLAHELQSTGAMLNKLFNYGLQAEKKIRSETFLTDGAISVSFAGVELARKIFTSLDDKQILLIGAGETAELAATHFLDKGVKNIHIVNRTMSKAEQLAQKFNGKAYSLEQLVQVLGEVDIVISATSSSEYVVTRQLMQPICRSRHHKPIFMIDLAIPRDLDPKIDDLDGAYLYNLDDLNEVVHLNMEKRKQEIPKSLKIADDYVEQFMQWLSTHSLASTINRLKRYFEDIRQRELDRLRNRLPQDGYQEIEYLTQSIINKLMHQHIKTLKKSAAHPDQYQKHIDFFYNLYELDDES